MSSLACISEGPESEEAAKSEKGGAHHPDEPAPNVERIVAALQHPC